MKRLLLAPLILALGLPVHAGSPDFFDDQQIKDFLEKAHGREIADEEIKEYRDAECVGIEMRIASKIGAKIKNPTRGVDKKMLKYCKLDNAKIKELKKKWEYEYRGRGTNTKAIRAPDQFLHKGKLYIASRVCEEGRWMQWMTYPSFLGIGGRVEELGCMTRLEHERYMRNYRMGIDSRPVIINNPAPTPQPIRSAPLQFDYNPPTTNYSSPFAPKQPSQIRLYNNNSPGGVQNCSRFGNTNSFNCY